MKSIISILVERAAKISYSPHLFYIPRQVNTEKFGVLTNPDFGWACRFSYYDNFERVTSVVHGFETKEQAYECAFQCWREIEKERMRRYRHFQTIA